MFSWLQIALTQGNALGRAHSAPLLIRPRTQHASPFPPISAARRTQAPQALDDSASHPPGQEKNPAHSRLRIQLTPAALAALPQTILSLRFLTLASTSGPSNVHNPSSLYPYLYPPPDCPLPLRRNVLNTFTSAPFAQFIRAGFITVCRT
ncbi:hypothetical protein CVT26_006791 [Gymnopilus dilepis]|uniref:Uncharacterized protein n=1 Tax=Gymnopilus dilepis TaxID=231916 RepID=A0A409Y359_9AGAR|nr:hypothetical protein CVT26_006791 [Gymnopilus dilepis]